MLANGDLLMTIEAVDQLDIHGSIYYDLTFNLEGQNGSQKMRINPEAFYNNPQPGDKVNVSMVMGNIMSASKIE